MRRVQRVQPLKRLSAGRCFLFAMMRLVLRDVLRDVVVTNEDSYRRLVRQLTGLIA